MVLTSAVTGEGVEDFLNAVDARLSQSMETLELTLDVTEGKKIAWLYAHGEVQNRTDDEHGVHITVRLDAANARRFETL